MWFARQSDGYRAWFTLVDTGGDVVPGASAGEFTVTVVDPADSTSTTVAVAESTQKPGLYTFLVPSAFVTTNGTGVYGILIEVDVMGPPAVSDVMSSPLRVEARLFDDTLDVVVDDTVTAQTALQYLLSMAAGEFDETEISGDVSTFAFKDRAGAALFTLRIEDLVGRTRTVG